jgi:S-ribosylhomocysteine lyase
MTNVESFTLDHTKVKAPFVRKSGMEERNGVRVSKFDLRLLQPNAEEMPTGAVHTLEHFLAGFMRDKLDGVIDISPMGCRTGFYMITWGDVQVKAVIEALTYSLEKVLEQDEVPAANELQCGNYRDHSLSSAKEYAKHVLMKGLSDEIYQ